MHCDIYVIHFDINVIGWHHLRHAIDDINGVQCNIYPHIGDINAVHRLRIRFALVTSTSYQLCRPLHPSVTSTSSIGDIYVMHFWRLLNTPMMSVLVGCVATLSFLLHKLLTWHKTNCYILYLAGCCFSDEHFCFKLIQEIFICFITRKKCNQK